ncbi:kelch motif family protein [Panicum miliaceum]|uniref:Kelch motif family protein n=1 Tax=Panicum miliaceum TaxID=4540 RepID=A0A3L6PTH1_PANMI|nr:kelch motif family protein [Panicum miliaceum]
MAASRPLPLRLAVPLALALVADFLRASSSSRRISALSSSARTAKGKRAKAVERAVGHLNATYADLPAPRWDWEEMPAAPVPRLDGAAVLIGDLLYVFAGYGSLDHLLLAHRTKNAKSFRYAPATQLWRGRLHVMGGGKEDRHEPGLEHWSLAVKDGKALENEWRAEVPIPHGGPHRACVVANDKLFVIGGQEGDFMAKPGSPIFKYDGSKWKQVSPMPKPDSHVEFAWVVVNNSIVIVGGTTEKHPITKKMILVGEVFRFDLETMTWSVIGRMPFRIKTALAGYWQGWLYFTSGQRDRGPDNPGPKNVVGTRGPSCSSHLFYANMSPDFLLMMSTCFGSHVWNLKFRDASKQPEELSKAILPSNGHTAQLQLLGEDTPDDGDSGDVFPCHK